jgi:hypothetical protein
MNIPDDSYKTPLVAEVNGPVVIISGVDAVCVAMSPEAVLESLTPLKLAAEEALNNRRKGIHPQGFL